MKDRRRTRRALVLVASGLSALAVIASAALLSRTGPTDDPVQQVVAVAEPPREASAEAARFISYFNSIHLTAEQENLKTRALLALPAPCCSKFSMATCCCPCNFSKAVWGLSKYLIAEKGEGEEQVREAVRNWIRSANPSGFSGEACFKGRCESPFHEDGCGGMRESAIR